VADSAVRVEGLREFQRALKNVSPELNKGLRVDIKTIAANVAAEARSHAVHRTGRYAASIRPYVSGTRAQIGSRLPQAGVLHWGGTIRPRGVAITFPARPVVSEAVDRQADKIVDLIGDAFDQAAHRAGWK
jgi:phage gpG-like protein